MATSTQWRINVTANNGGAQLGVTEFQFRQTVGVPLAFPGGTSVAADSTQSFAYNANAGKNDDILYGWRTASGVTASTWSATFVATTPVVSFVLCGDADPTFSPKDFTAEYFDGSAWVVAGTWTDQAGWGAYETREYVLGQSGYRQRQGVWNESSDQWRLDVTTNNGAAFVGLIDFQLASGSGFYGAMDENYAGTASASSAATGRAAPAATDSDNSASSWRSDGTTAAWFQYTFPGGLPFPVLSYKFRTDTIGSAPRDFTLKYYDYATDAWVVADTRTGQGPDASNGTDHTYTLTRSTVVQAQLNAPEGNFGDVVLGNGASPWALTAFTTSPLNPLDGAVNLGDANNLGPTFGKTPWTVSGAAINQSVNRGAVDLGAGETPWRVAGALTSSGFINGSINLGGVAAFAATPWTLAATAVSAQVGNGDIRLGALATPWTLDAWAVPENLADGDATLQPFDVPGGSLEPALPYGRYALAATGLAGTLATGNIVLLAPDAAGELLAGGASTGDITLPRFAVTGDNGIEAGATLEPYALAATGVAGALMDGAIRLGEFTTDAVSLQDGSGDGAPTLPLFEVRAVAVADNVGTGAAVLLPLRADGAGATGIVADGQITVPLFAVSASGYADNIGIATISLPRFQLDATTLAPAIIAPIVTLPAPTVTAVTTVAVNTRTRAVTTYDNLRANSYARFAGMVLAATEDGIVALVGDTDNGQAINAYLTSGTSDYGSDVKKRVLAGYIGYRASGTTAITVITDEHTEYTYPLEPRKEGLHPARRKFGRGVDGRYAAWKFANVDGADFQIDGLSLDVDLLSRRT
jgi:hypothetical protein